MTDSRMDPFELILRQCAEAAPAPWYPRAFAETTGIPRDTLDPFLERLRLHGLVRLTDWVAGNGQGYALTPEGERVLHSPSLLAQLRTGRLPAPRPEPDEEPAERGRAPTAYERGETIRAGLLSDARPVVTYVLLAANILVFLVGAAVGLARGVQLQDMVMGQSHAVLHQTGSILATDLLQGTWWSWLRLLTCCFVHIGMVHLGVNMYSLYVVGPLLERMWGHVRFLVLYLIAGLGGSCVAMIVSPVDRTGAVINLAGASGALWGIMTSMAVWVLLNRRFLPPALASTWLRQLLVVFVLNVFISFMPGISASAHFGGGAVGAVTAVLLNWQRFGPGLLRWVAAAGVVVVPVLALVAVAHAPVFNRQWDQLEIEVYYLPRVRTLEADARKLVGDSQAEKLLEQNPQRRDQAAAGQAMDALTQGGERLAAAVKLLRRSGPYRDPQVVEARQVRLEQLQARMELFQLSKRCLEMGDKWTEKDEQQLQEQSRRVEELDRRWRNLVAGAALGGIPGDPCAALHDA